MLRPYRCACLRNLHQPFPAISQLSFRHAKITTVSNSSATTPTTSTPQSSILSPTTSIRKEVLTLFAPKPRTPGLRHVRKPINTHLWKGAPVRKLTFVKVGHAKGGRNSSGRITVRHRGGGHRRRIRTVDFSRMVAGPHLVERIEYDPNRSAHLALISPITSPTTPLLSSPSSSSKPSPPRSSSSSSTKPPPQEKKQTYIIAAEGMRAGDTIESFRLGIPKSLITAMGGAIDPGVLAAKTAFRGNCLPVRMVPIGTQVYNVGSRANGPAVFCRSAGTHALVIGRDEVGNKVRSVSVRLQSGEVRTVSAEACATVGVASNPFHQFRQLGKAGRSRWLNIRPTVRGLAMNACKYFLLSFNYLFKYRVLMIMI